MWLIGGIFNEKSEFIIHNRFKICFLGQKSTFFTQNNPIRPTQTPNNHKPNHLTPFESSGGLWFSSDKFKKLNVYKQMSLSYGWDEPQRWPKNAFFSCVIGIYFVTFFFEHIVYLGLLWIWGNVHWTSIIRVKKIKQVSYLYEIIGKIQTLHIWDIVLKGEWVPFPKHN